MATNTWGVPGKTEQPEQRPPSKRAPLTPKAARAAHKGIVWLHASAISVWLLVAIIFGILMAAGKNVPPVLVIACSGAALGHAIFLATHLFLARKAKRRIAATG